MSETLLAQAKSSQYEKNYDGKRYKGRLKAEFFGDTWSVEHSPPLSLSVLREPGSQGFVALPGDASGGLRSGDSHDIDVTLSEGAKLSWQAPASVLYYGDRARDETCRTCLHLKVDDSSALFFRNRPNIPCLAARVKQEVKIELSADCEFFYLDSWTAGRQGSGETWAFAELSLETKLRVEGKLVFLERWDFAPSKEEQGKKLADSKSFSYLKSPAVMASSHFWVSAFSKGPAMKKRLVAEKNLLLSYGAVAELGELAQDLWMLRARLDEAWDANTFRSRAQNVFSGAAF